MKTDRRRFIGATIGLLGGMAFKIPEPPTVLLKQQQGYCFANRGIVHTSVGDITIPVKNVISRATKVVYVLEPLTDVTMDFVASGVTLIDPCDHAVIEDGSNRVSNFDCPPLVSVGDMLKITVTHNLKYDEILHRGPTM